MRVVLRSLVVALVAMPALVAPAFAADQGAKLSVEQRLQRVEDELAIRRILVEYSATQDDHDYAAYVALFAKDGEWGERQNRAQRP